MAECKCKVKIVYPTVRCEDAPVPPALPVPKCECGIPAEVKQSRGRLQLLERTAYVLLRRKCTL